MNYEQMKKQSMQSFRQVTHQTCVFNMACVGACKCVCMPFPSRPDVSNIKLRIRDVQRNLELIKLRTNEMLLLKKWIFL